jgi:hypothetical protein
VERVGRRVKAPTLPLSRRARADAREVAGNQRPWPADKVERWSIDRLIPYAKNARTHTDAQVAAIAASIKEWGWTTPALVGEDGGLIAGHARILAARQLGIAEIPVMVAAGWSEAQKRAYVRADNQLVITGSGWDPELLLISADAATTAYWKERTAAFHGRTREPEEVAGPLLDGGRPGDQGEGLLGACGQAVAQLQLLCADRQGEAHGVSLGRFE